MANSAISNTAYSSPPHPGVTKDRGPGPRQAQAPAGGSVRSEDRDEQRRVQEEVQKLKAQEEKIKAHEAAHKAAGGQHASSASYSYRPGPDGRSYIVAGEVQVDLSPERTPQATIAKMQVVQRAAMAPADPSGQDRAVAAQAAAIAAQARQEEVKAASAEQPQVTAAVTAGGASGLQQSAPSASAGSAKAAEAGERGEAAGRAGGAAGEEADPADIKIRQEGDTRQIAQFKANTNPGDLFAAQKMSVYA